LGHTPNYGIADCKFRKIVKFSVEFLDRRFRRKVIFQWKFAESLTAIGYCDTNLDNKAGPDISLD